MFDNTFSVFYLLPLRSIGFLVVFFKMRNVFWVGEIFFFCVCVGKEGRLVRIRGDGRKEGGINENSMIVVRRRGKREGGGQRQEKRKRKDILSS